ncbi:MAG: hypothetical protein ACO27Q_03485 [Bacteroidia bacterium]
MEQLRESFLLHQDQGITDVRDNVARALAQTGSWTTSWIQEQSFFGRLREDLKTCKQSQYSPAGKPIFMLLKDFDIRKFFKS